MTKMIGVNPRYLIIVIFFGVIAFFANNQIDVIAEKIYSINTKISLWTMPPKPSDSLAISYLLDQTKNLPTNQASRVLHISNASHDKIWLILDTVKWYRNKSLTENEWQQFLKTGDIPQRVIEKRNQDEEIKAQERQRLRHELLQELQSLKTQKNIYYCIFLGSLVITGLFSLLFLKDNVSFAENFAGNNVTKNIHLAGNTILILVAFWAYTETQHTVITIALASCAVTNAYISIKSIANKEFSAWLIYTVNIFLLAVGIWFINSGKLYWNSEWKIGVIICLIGVVNIYRQYGTLNMIKTINTQSQRTSDVQNKNDA